MTKQWEKASKMIKEVTARRDKSKPYRPPKIYDRNKIRELLTKGYSINKVARMMGCSASPVQAVRTEMTRFGYIFKEKG